jgi:predicted nucleic acid-binding protein
VTLIDAGPMVAIVDCDDQHHAECVETCRRLPETFGTVWPALTEAMHLLKDVPGGQEALWEMLARGAFQLMPLNFDDIPRIRELMRKYADQPMDLADAALLRVAEREGIHAIFTVDKKDFGVYRLHGKGRIRLIP